VPGVPRIDLCVVIDTPLGSSTARVVPTVRERYGFSRRRPSMSLSARRREPMTPAGCTLLLQRSASRLGRGRWAFGGRPVSEPSDEDGVIAITLLRSVGWLSRFDLRAGPSRPPRDATDGAQLRGRHEARLALLADVDPAPHAPLCWTARRDRRAGPLLPPGSPSSQSRQRPRLCRRSSPRRTATASCCAAQPDRGSDRRRGSSGVPGTIGATGAARRRADDGTLNLSDGAATASACTRFAHRVARTAEPIR